MARLLSSYSTPAGGYGGRYQLPDGTEANVTTEFTGAGLETSTELEAARPLTDAEADELLDADARHDHQNASDPYQPLPVQRRF